MRKKLESRSKNQDMKAAPPVSKSAISNHKITNRGILIIALGSPEYGRMAANLASSIRFADKDMKIHLVWSGESISHLTDAHKALFTSMAECPKEYYSKPHPKSLPVRQAGFAEKEGLQNPLLRRGQGEEKTVYIKAKTCMYELSPFDETLFLDADMIWFSNRQFKNATTVFNELKGVELTFQNRGHFDLSKDVLNENYSNWCNIKEVKEKYFTGAIEKGKGRFYHLHSEFVFFRRSESNRQFFDLCREIFDNPKVKPAAFDGDIPDELAFDIAVALTGKNPHKENYLPIHWFAMDGKVSMHDLHDKYYGLSIGGNNLPARVVEKYKMLAKVYARALGLPYSFTITPKKRWSPTRKAA
jgi:hypothetical protein